MANLKFSQLPNLTTPVANTIVPVVSGGVNYTSTMANITAFVNTNSGAISATSLSASGNVTGAFVKGNGSELTNLPAANIVGTVANATYATSAGSAATANTATSATTATTATSATTAGTVTTPAQPNITSVGTLTSLTSSGNITASYFLGNGSQLTGLPATYSNSNVTTLLASFGSNTISTTGNITGGYILGNGSQLTGLPATYGNSNVSTLLAAFGSNTISTTGNVATGNLVATGTMNATGNIAGNFFNGNGSALTGIVTSIIAGSGISVNQATGAVTVTATGGGGGGSSISNGTSNVNIASSGGNITVSTAGRTNLANFQSNIPAVRITGNLTVDNPTQTTGGSTTDGFIEIRNYATIYGNASVGGTLGVTGFTTLGSGSASNFTINSALNVNGSTLTVDSSGKLNQALKTRTGTTSGTAGDIAWDANYIYVCTATNVWKRAALSSF